MKRSWLVLVGVAACGGSDTSVRDLVVRGAAEAESEGHLVEVAVLDPEGRVVATDATSVAEGVYAVELSGVLDEGVRYEVHVYLDASDDLACQAPPTDPGWRLAVGPVEGSIVLDVPGEGTDDVCATFAEGA